MLRTLKIAAAAALLAGGVAYAQIPGTEVFSRGAITVGNCAKWLAPGIIGDAGKTCGSGGCSGAADFSDGCAAAIFGH